MWDSADFLPHSICLALSPTVMWLHAVSDTVIALSYYSIPLVLLVFARRRAEGQWRWVLMLFAAFVLACGTVHVLSVVTLWVPIYVEQGLLKAVTALVSLGTAVVLWPLLPVALKAPTRSELEARVLARTAELEQAKAMAERANEAKSRFLAAASHDLRQPFQAMTLFRDALEPMLTTPAQREVLQALGKAMDSGRDLLNALLHVSTLDAGITVPRPETMCLSELLPGLAEEYRRQAESQGLELRFVPCSATIVSDPVLLGRMVRNLLANALRYTPKGRILLGCRRRGDKIVLEVWDTGIGIPADRQADIWEEFTQLGNLERDRSKGLGLGLAIVSRTAGLLSVPIGVRSTVGKGSVFFVELPRA